MDAILNFFNQQSTWKGLIGLGTAAGVVITPEQSAAITAFGMALIALINIFRNENKEK